MRILEGVSPTSVSGVFLFGFPFDALAVTAGSEASTKSGNLDMSLLGNIVDGISKAFRNVVFLYLEQELSVICWF